MLSEFGERLKVQHICNKSFIVGLLSDKLHFVKKYISIALQQASES